MHFTALRRFGFFIALPHTVSNQKNIQRPFQPNSSSEGVLRISSDRDDRMGAKMKTLKKSFGLETKPKKILDQNLSPKISNAEFPSRNKNVRKA